MSERWFPIQHTHSPHGERFRVPWRIAVKAHAVYAAHYDQSCERIAERGGFELIEMLYLLAGENPFRANDGPMQSDFFNRFPGEMERYRPSNEAEMAVQRLEADLTALREQATTLRAQLEKAEGLLREYSDCNMTLWESRWRKDIDQYFTERGAP